VKPFLCLLLSLVLVPSARAESVVLASGSIPADTRDNLGDTVGGLGSGIARDPESGLFFCIPDRGAGDGTIDFRPRYVKVRLDLEGDDLNPQVVESVLFRDEEGREMSGLIPDDPKSEIPRLKDGRICLDPEAIAAAPDGTLYVTDEYGPLLYQFSRDGKMIRRIELPEIFRPRRADGHVDFTNTDKLVHGRAVNQGPEGMCLLPDGKSVALIFQSGLMQDGAHKSPATNLLILDLASGKPTALYAYPFSTVVPETSEPQDIDSVSVNDLAALSDTRLLVLERDNRGRNGSLDYPVARNKAVWIADLSMATNILNHGSAATARPVSKTLLFNLPAIVPDPKRLAAKWEGIVIVPPLHPSAVTLVMTADNDFLTPILHIGGKEVPFPRAQDKVESQFFKIRSSLPEKP